MFDLYSYTDKDTQALIDSMIYLVDTREHDGKNDHILKAFDKMNIKWKKKKLNYCDYSFMIPANPELGIMRDMDFSHKIVIERKANLDEICGNITKERDRIEKEFALAPQDKVLIIENATYSDMIHGKYRSQYAPKSFWATMHSFWHRYNIPVVFLQDPTDTAYFIRGYFQYWLREKLK